MDETQAKSEPQASEPPLVTVSSSSESAVKNYKYVTSLSWALTTVIICCVIFGVMREDGIYGDDYLWMRYQTLMTPAHYTNYIWFPLLILQALFIHGSLFTFKSSPLVGYSALASPVTDSTTERAKLYINCPIIHYPGMCAMSMLMTYSFDREYILFATVFAALGTVICSKIILTQLAVLAEADVTSGDGADEEAGREKAGSEAVASKPLSFRFLHEFVALRLPFELFAGYTVCLVFLFLNTWMHVFGLNPKALVIMANTSIIALLVIAAYILWGLKQGNGRHLYGSAISVVWYLVGVAVELQSPTQPIYNQFSDAQIMTSQILAGMASTLLSSLMAARMIKTVIKRNMFNCMGACQGKDAEDTAEDDITTGYVHA